MMMILLLFSVTIPIMLLLVFYMLRRPAKKSSKGGYISLSFSKFETTKQVSLQSFCSKISIYKDNVVDHSVWILEEGEIATSYIMHYEASNILVITPKKPIKDFTIVLIKTKNVKNKSRKQKK